MIIAPNPSLYSRCSRPPEVRWKASTQRLLTHGYGRDRGVNLRGCIGNLSPIDLHEGVVKYASVSAFQDRRFSPIEASEIPALQCSVTLLHSYEQGANCYDWKVL